MQGLQSVPVKACRFEMGMQLVLVELPLLLALFELYVNSKQTSHDLTLDVWQHHYFTKGLFVKLNWRILQFCKGRSQMDMTQNCGSQCSRGSGVNIANNFDPIAPTDPNIYLSRFTPSYCLKRQNRPLPSRVRMLLKDVICDWWLSIWHGCLSTSSLIVSYAFMQCAYWHKFKSQVNVETFLTSNQHRCSTAQALRFLTLIMDYYYHCGMNTEVTESVQIDPYNSVFVPGLD